MTARRVVHPAIGVALLTVILASPASLVAQRAPTDPLELGKQGWAALEARRFGDALETFNQAAAARPDDPGLAMGAGAAAFMLGRNAEAVTWLEAALQLNPRFVEASFLLGELYYRAGRVTEAIATYEVAATLAPERPVLGERLQAWKTEARLLSGFRESRSPHFSIFFQAPGDEAAAGHVMATLEAAYARIGAALGAYPGERITVVLYSREQFQAVRRLPRWAAGSYDGRIRVPAPGADDSQDKLEAVLGHELTHAVISGLGGRAVPVWLNEGLAAVFEPHGAEDAAMALARTDQRIALSSLHESFSSLPEGLVGLAYAQSAHAVARLMSMGGAATVVALLQDLAAGVEFREAFARRFGLPYEDFEKDMTR
jgi:tetratricopeptide (TPR) repeat protein